MEDIETEEVNGKSFAVTNDKIRTSSPIKLQSWCPTMDLLAIVTVITNFILNLAVWKSISSSSIFILAKIVYY